MSENKPVSETNDAAIEAVIADSAGGNEPQPEAEEGAQRKTGLATRILVLLFVVIALVFASLAAGGKLQPLFDKVKASLSTLHPASVDSHSVTEPQAESSAVVPDESATAITHESGSFVLPVTPSDGSTSDQSAADQSGADQQVEQAQSQPVEPAAEVTPPPAVESSSVGKAEIDRLMTTIDALSNELALMRKAQNELKTNREQQQQMDLQVRTGWLVDPAISLQQVQQAWEEIALLPGLTAGQRDEANRMHALAARSVHLVDQWREALVQWADMMAAPAHPEMLPQPEHPWLAWIVGQFHLHRAPSDEVRRLSGLRTRLLDTARHLTLEEWPDKASWQSLRAELLLQAQAMAAAKGEAMPELGLPENLDALQQDIATLHDTAERWNARGQGGN